MRVKIDDISLHCELRGDGPPVLFVHGFPITGEMWLPTADRLGPGWRLIIPDLRGHGRSDVSEVVTMARFADDLAAMLDALDDRRPAVVVGLSMGGIIAFEFFRRHRARVRAFVLTCTRANAESPEGVARREALAAAVLRDGSRVAADTMIENLFSPTAPSELKRHWYGVMCATPPIGLAAASRALATRPDSFTTLPQIDVPTLVVAGAHDNITPPETLREIHARIPSSRFEVIADAGHLPPVEQPERFAAALRSFLGELA